MKNGDRAGSQNKKDKYYSVYAFGKIYKLHLLIFLYHKGYFPENEIDHINQNREDNRIENLREVTETCNARNRPNPCHNKTGVMGVCDDPRSDRFVVYIFHNKKRIHLGRFKTLLSAAKARWEAEKKYGWPNCNTTSSAYQHLKFAVGGF